MKNKKIKSIFLVISMMSISILLAIIPLSAYIFVNSDGLWTSYMHKEKQIIEEDFYKSNMFEFKVLRPLSYWMGESVSNIDYQVDKYIVANTYIQWDDKKIIPTEKNAREAINKSINNSKINLNSLKNIKFMAINTEDNSYYTNTDYKTISEFEQGTKGYLDIKIDTTPNVRSYKKEMNGNVFENNKDVEWNILDAIDKDNIKLYASFPKETIGVDKISEAKYLYEKDLNTINICILIAIINLIICIIAIIIQKQIKPISSNDDNKKINLLNKIPLEIWLAILVIGGFDVKSFIYNNYYIDGDYFTSVIITTMRIFILVLTLYILLKYYNNYDKKSDMLKNTIIYKSFKVVKLLSKKGINEFEKIIKLSKEIPLARRLLLIGIGCLSINAIGVLFGPSISHIFTVIGSTIVLTFFIIYTIKKLDYINEIMEGTKKIKEGNINYKIPIKGNNNFTVLAENINNIGQGLENSIHNQLKSERMKSELITNVSHDLKTPLTSIINYVELIKKEENIEPQHIKEYINVLDSKSRRLKILIEDLFEASKVGSGSIELNMEKIELNQLLRQIIGEMEQKLSTSNLDIKLNIPEEKIYINADGKRMYRVFENLLSNISKYSLSGTRVYIDLKENEDNIQLSMKNISSYELNFDSSEIMERFKRGDKSRNTEGSGLGLAIAKDLINLQGGQFNIDIDGDLFKATIEFKKYYIK